MSPRWRKALLTLHIGTSVGWLGAILAYIALNIPIYFESDEQTTRAAFLMMEVVAVYAIAPLAVASVVSGVIQSLGTPWGLVRHYWVLISLVVSVFALVVLLLHLPAVAAMADRARDTGVAVDGMGGDLFHSLLGLLVLLIPLVLNVYKPRGLTPYGWRARRGMRS